MTKEKEQKDKEQLEDTKEVIKSHFIVCPSSIYGF
jgi:hypothetical protein